MSCARPMTQQLPWSLNTPVIGDAPNYYLGLIRRDGTPKPAFATVKLLLHLFGRDSIAVDDSALRVDVRSGPSGDLQHHLFQRPDGTRLAFVWATHGASTVRLHLNSPASTAIGWTLDGAPHPWPVRDGELDSVRLAPDAVAIFELPSQPAKP